MKNTPWYRKPEMVVALSALIMSLVTTIVAIYSAYIDRAYARASVWPRLEMYQSNSDGNFRYGLTNSGTGPAIIKYAEVTYKDKPIKNWREIPNIPRHIQSHMSSKVLLPEQIINPIKSTDKSAKIFREIDKAISISLCYCSIYDECWLIDRSNKPTNIAQCTINEELAFTQ